MINLLKMIPDMDFLISLTTEELGIKILFLLKEECRVNNGKFTVNHLLNSIHNNGGNHNPILNISNFNQSKKIEVEQAILEAWSWLEVQGFIVWPDTTNGANGYRKLSRIADRFTDEAKAANYVFSSKFSKELLHPRIAGKIWNLFVREEYEIAVLQAFKEVEVYVRDAAKLKPEDIGTSLMRKAFNRDNGALADKNLPEAEREAVANLFAGAIGTFKNPQSHRYAAVTSPEEAMEMIMIANYLLRTVDYNSSGKGSI